jgi:hypothetical protein
LGSLSNRTLLVNNFFDVALYAGIRVVSARLFQRDIEKVVNAILDEMVEALRRGFFSRSKSSIM